MVIRGKPRGNGRQLGEYLLTIKDNDDIQILEVDGRRNPADDYLHQTIFSIQLNSELTNSRKGLYHAQINPAAGEAERMTTNDWYKAADILGRELALEDQRRIIVLHGKKGRTHAHVVWERYDHETGLIKSDSFSRLAQDRARKEMEFVFGHAQTPHRNKHRPELKAALTEIWSQTETGAEFIKEARKAGYMVAEGAMDNPFMVVDENGRSFNLVRQLKGVRIKEVRSRLKDEPLTPEKQAIEIMRTGKADSTGKGKQEIDQSQSAKTQAAQGFADNNKGMFEKQNTTDRAVISGSYLQSGEDITAQPEQSQELLNARKMEIAQTFAENSDLMAQEAAEKEKRIQERIAEQKEIRERTRIRKRGRS